MWNALRSDFQELVSVVKEDTNVVIDKIADEQDAKKKSAAMHEAERRMSVEETFTVPLLPSTPKADKTEVISVESELSNGSEESDEPEIILDPQERGKIEAFLENLKITDHTDEISAALEKYPDTLRVQFEALVPEFIRYEEFWTRYLYRCDEQRIEREWTEEEERNRKARAELVGSVSNFLGGAAKAVASGVANALTEDDAGNPGKAAKAIFPSSGRPPFVMNTAVDEDDDEEEELGWDDEEDDDEEFELSSGGVASNQADDPPSEEQIEFKDEALEAARDQLKQAMEERDQLHQTVELQKKELANLKAGKEPNDEVDKLRHQLLENVSQLQALKTERDGSTGIAAKTNIENAQKIEQLTGLLSAKELELENLKNSSAQANAEFETTMSSLKQDNEDLRVKLASVETGCRSQVSILQAESAQVQSSLANSELRLETITAELAASKAAEAMLQSQLLELREAAAAKQQEVVSSGDEEASGAKSPSTLNTVSSGVKVDKPVLATKLELGDDDDDDDGGWDDDW